MKPEHRNHNKLKQSHVRDIAHEPHSSLRTAPTGKVGNGCEGGLRQNAPVAIPPKGPRPDGLA